MSTLSDLELCLANQISWAGLPAPMREYRFAPPRRWRFDFAWPTAMLAVEVQGAIWTGGKHGRGTGIERDHSKMNAAQLAGWRVLQYSRKTVEDGTALTEIKEALTWNPSP